MSVDGAKLTGWKYDKTNTYLEVWVRGTNVARFDDATADLTLITNGLTVDSGGITVTGGAVVLESTTASSSTTTGSIQTDGGLGVAEKLYIGGSLTIADKITYSDQLYHAGALMSNVDAALTLDAEDVGKIFTADSDDTVFTLPATSAGLVYTIVNTCSDGGCKVSFLPHSDDKIMGLDIVGADSSTLINTAATSVRGDMCKLMGDGSLGWYIMECHGTWEQEA